MFYQNYPERFKKLVESVGEEYKAIWGISSKHLDLNSFLPTYINGENFKTSVDVNANVEAKTVASLLQESSKPFMKMNNLYLIWKGAKKFWGEDEADKIILSILHGDVYPNDLVLFAYTPYCWNFSSVHLALTGLPFIPRVPSQPALHADSFIQHAIQLIMYASNHQSGATGIAGLIPIWSMFCKHDRLNEKQIAQQFQWFVYSINQPVRYSYQSPFVNLTIFDYPSLNYLYKDVYIPQIKMKFDPDYALMVQKLAIEHLINDMEKSGNVFTFPVLTCNVVVEKNWFKQYEPVDSNFFDWATQVNSKYGNINFFFVKKDENNFALASCCRLLNREQLFNSSFGAGGEGIGAIGSVVVNLPRIGFMFSGDFTGYKNKLKEVLDVVYKLLFLRKYFVEKRINEKMLPLYDHGFIDITRQFLIVGINGMWESIKALLEKNFTLTNYVNFAQEVLKTILEENAKAESKYGENVKFAIEQVPAEVLAVKLAQLDKISGLQDKYTLYSNQWIPLTESVTLWERIDVAGQLDKYCLGGAILHLNLEHPISSEHQKKILMDACNRNISYLAINYDLSKCNSCKTIVAYKTNICPQCGSVNLDYFYRVVGFITNVKKSWISERQVEYERRIRY